MFASNVWASSAADEPSNIRKASQNVWCPLAIGGRKQVMQALIGLSGVSIEVSEVRVHSGLHSFNKNGQKYGRRK